MALSFVRFLCVQFVFNEGRVVTGTNAARSRVSLAAIFCQIGQKGIHGRVFGGIDQRPPLPAKRHQPGVPQLIEVKREGIAWHAKPFGYLAGRQPVRPGLHKQTEDIQAGVLGKRRQSRNGLSLFHRSIILESLF
ncbi:hypothetical protein [Acidocella sp.]|uniref:hypothetical protein n=1 Tax=Acidocella sp. TaxID=50710 RepID=UPI003FD89586